MNTVKEHDGDPHLMAIRAVVAALRPGEVLTYGHVAARAGLPGRARLVGRALRTAPDGLNLPWHRVVGAGGRIVFPAGSDAASRQATLLTMEGVQVTGQRVQMPIADNLDALLWGAPSADKMPRSAKSRKR